MSYSCVQHNGIGFLMQTKGDQSFSFNRMNWNVFPSFFAMTPQIWARKKGVRHKNSCHYCARLCKRMRFFLPFKGFWLVGLGVVLCIESYLALLWTRPVTGTINVVCSFPNIQGIVPHFMSHDFF